MALRVGLLWFDDDPRRPLRQKVAQAAERYQEKFGRPPRVCYVHPSALEEGGGRLVDGIRILPLPAVLRHHLFLCQE